MFEKRYLPGFGRHVFFWGCKRNNAGPAAVKDTVVVHIMYTKVFRVHLHREPPEDQYTYLYIIEYFFRWWGIKKYVLKERWISLYNKFKKLPSFTKLVLCSRCGDGQKSSVWVYWRTFQTLKLVKFNYLLCHTLNWSVQ